MLPSRGFGAHKLTGVRVVSGHCKTRANTGHGAEAGQLAIYDVILAIGCQEVIRGYVVS